VPLQRQVRQGVTRGSGQGHVWERQFNEHGHNYAMVGGLKNPSLCGLSEAEIHGMMHERMKCKFAWDFSSTDHIERELKMAGMIMDIGSKAWRAGREEMEKGGGEGGSKVKALMDYTHANKRCNSLLRDYGFNIDDRDS
jgi:hypothetical protein